MGFGARLARKRRERGITQADLGKGLGTDGKDLTKAVVSGWENDQHSPRVDQLAMLCERLGCSADFLLFGKEVTESLSPEAAVIARRIDALPEEWRADALHLCSRAIDTVAEMLRVTQVTNKDGAPQSASDVRQLRRKT